MKQAMQLRGSSSKAGGFYILLFALLMFAIVAVLALVLGLGFIATGKTRVQHLANLAALTVVQSYVEQGYPGVNPTPIPSVRLATAVARANQILGENRIAGVQQAFGDLTTDPSSNPDNGGVVQLGAWFHSDPDGPAGPRDPCQANYPCFCTETGSAACAGETPPLLVNAARVSVQNKASNPLYAPFVKVFGQDAITVASSATASVVPRCTAYVFDVSPSAGIDSHPLSYPMGTRKAPLPPDWQFLGAPSGYVAPSPDCYGNAAVGVPNYLPYYVTCPANSSLFAFSLSNVVGLGTISAGLPIYPWGMSVFDLRNWCDLAIAHRHCSNTDLTGWVPGPYLTRDNIERVLWCSVLCQHNGIIRDRAPLDADLSQYYPQDYADQYSPYGRMLVDLRRDPQPLASFLGAFNAGLRKVKLSASAADTAVLVAFAGGIRSQVPTSGTTNDLDYLIQLTNVRNRGQIIGTVGVPPNAVPVFASGVEIHPNFIDKGFFPVLGTDSTTNDTYIVGALQAAIDALKNSCPASNAKRSIILATDGVSTCADQATPCPGTRDWATYQLASSQLQNSIKTQLIQNRIALTTILKGQGVQPNIKNVLRNPSDPSLGYMTYSEAVASGLASGFYDGSSTPNNSQTAFEQVGLPGVYFRDPNPLFGGLSMETGGIFCPLANTICGEFSPGSCSGCPACTAADHCITDFECYQDHDGKPETPPRLRDCARTPGATLSCAYELYSTAADASTRATEQAAVAASACVDQTIGLNPYILVERDS